MKFYFLFIVFSKVVINKPKEGNKWKEHNKKSPDRKNS